MKPIPGYGGYFATKSGEIWSNREGRLIQLKSRPHYRSRYMRVNLCVNKKSKTLFVHTLVLLAFVSPRPAGQEARHKNGIRGDNRLDNLCWGTPKENTMDKIAHGEKGKLSAFPWIRLTADDVRSIRSRIAAGAKIRDLAKEYAVSPGTIYCIKNNETWREVLP